MRFLVTVVSLFLIVNCAPEISKGRNIERLDKAPTNRSDGEYYCEFNDGPSSFEILPDGETSPTHVVDDQGIFTIQIPDIECLSIKLQLVDNHCELSDEPFGDQFLFTDDFYGCIVHGISFTQFPSSFNLQLEYYLNDDGPAKKTTIQKFRKNY